ncbi:hypothetical protein Bpfe_001478 [Biomphalaria pfeifferi]|uniref:TNFR-Cys domain-containing protein n=1 Tax=Biomphalaria pfeifferi TaxID=112525 RepID=A0AAD8CAB7_BIOPF|nr:hypothetical protein Bpfe_001478 [Biomphalaria pfeifferi]
MLYLKVRWLLGIVMLATLLNVTVAVTTHKQSFALQNGTCVQCPPGTFSSPLSRSTSYKQMDTGNTDKQMDISVSQSLEQDIKQNHGVKLCKSGQFRDNETCKQCPPGTYQVMSLHRNNACRSYSEVPKGCVVTKEGTAFRNLELECLPSNSTIESLKVTALLNNGTISTNETTDLSTKTVTSTNKKTLVSGSNTMAVSLNNRFTLAISVIILIIVICVALIGIFVFVPKRKSSKTKRQKDEKEGAQLNSADTSV